MPSDNLIYLRETEPGKAEICVKAQGTDLVALELSDQQLINVLLKASEILAHNIRKKRTEVH